MTKKYEITAEIWLYPGKAAWHFLTVPEDIATEISDIFVLQKRGWGSLPVTITIGKTTWKTSIFPDKKTSSYLLPLKKEVRISEQLEAGDSVAFLLEISD